MVAKIAGPSQGEKPVTINEEVTSHLQVPTGRRAAIRVDSATPTLRRVLCTDNVTVVMVIIRRKERGEEVVEVEGGEEATLEGGDMTEMGGEGEEEEAEDNSLVQHPG